MAVKFHELVEEIRHLDTESKYELKDIFEKILIEEGRERIRKNIDEGKKEFEAGETRSFQNIDDLLKSLNDD